MENKRLYIGLGLIAVAGIGFYLWKKNKKNTETNSNVNGANQLKIYAPPAVQVAVPMFAPVPLEQVNGILMVDPANR